MGWWHVVTGASTAGGRLVGDWQVSLGASAEEWHGAIDV